jgi:ankyrin repeat/BTB/POZ domain-containing protein 1
VAYDVLCAADMYLLPGLKRQCGTALSRMLSIDNVVFMLRASRLFSLARLEASCAEFMASNIVQVCQIDSKFYLD